MSKNVLEKNLGKLLPIQQLLRTPLSRSLARRPFGKRPSGGEALGLKWSLETTTDIHGYLDMFFFSFFVVSSLLESTGRKITRANKPYVVEKMSRDAIFIFGDASY